ncbi:hypothetical protein [Mongoliibacter ruber]|uniref:Uncharacterized protein n=1 Tax=Mongoliibacter ruber TaxID=1750599 RepID=A0A2T0WV83_9BACT|nr:hypothetical protein [Mongoliibacter ruber]PRY90613.1 hypothetical protein CLW00_101277 [Mongoliibacter ruber]
MPNYFKYLCYTTKPYNTGERVAQFNITGFPKKKVDAMIAANKPDFPSEQYMCSLEKYPHKKSEFNRIKKPQPND